jgi:ubiquinone/menaquinone biosynthesis C-methylase UbiE
MSASDSTDRTHRTAHPPAASTAASTGADPAADRHMSVEEVAESYAGVADDVAARDWVDRLFAGRLRRRQFGDVDGRVLDVACGTGTNFRYLPPTVDLVGIDASPDMLAHARETLDGLGRDGELHEMDAASLAFPDDGFDAVVSAFSTCTFPDPIAALREMARVCRPDGRILLLEHGRSRVGPVARLQEWRAESHYESLGCRLDQEPLELVREAGLSVVDADEALLGVVTSIEADPARPSG